MRQLTDGFEMSASKRYSFNIQLRVFDFGDRLRLQQKLRILVRCRDRGGRRSRCRDIGNITRRTTVPLAAGRALAGQPLDQSRLLGAYLALLHELLDASLILGLERGDASGRAAHDRVVLLERRARGDEIGAQLPRGVGLDAGIAVAAAAD